MPLQTEGKNMDWKPGGYMYVKEDKYESLIKLLKSAHEIIKILEYKSMDSDGKMCECYFCTDDVYMKTHKSDCIVGKWLASYGKIKAE